MTVLYKYQVRFMSLTKRDCLFSIQNESRCRIESIGRPNLLYFVLTNAIKTIVFQALKLTL